MHGDTLGKHDRGAAPIARKSKALRLGLLGVFMAVLAGASVALDDSSSGWLRSLDLPGDFAKAVNLSEAFAHGFGAAAILGSILLCVGRDVRPAVWIAVLITLTSGLLANGMKSAFVRIRPHQVESIEVAGADGTAVSASGKEVVEASFWDARQRSFPSGHAATACGLAIGLSLIFPRARWIFATLAALACLQRISSGAHFPSDVFAGAAIAFFSSGLILLLPQTQAVLQRRSQPPAIG